MQTSLVYGGTTRLGDSGDNCRFVPYATVWKIPWASSQSEIIVK